ncbi:hypothetical protein OSSY52_14720 [Tepiditoga spiralis]|uniref:Uncharacterized protein n=1 Tax=Tepiditoga spiralis TaxID=2108365 RepID=A0A7G1G4M7_9BACT|nr:hypothetical protein [Tepiditoga spiralis]BBE31331.1 hypothetical protein OSSY52_14720 [Tepiditoga spiralis]
MDYKNFHDTFVKNSISEGFIHDDHIHPVILMWIEFTEESKRSFLNLIKKNDEEYAEEMEDYLKDYDINTVIVPVYFPFEAHDDEELNNFLNFLTEISNITKVHSYSVLSEISLHDDDVDMDNITEEDEENFEFHPSIFSEGEDGKCYMDVLDYESHKKIEDLSGEFDCKDEYILDLRLPIFKK